MDFFRELETIVADGLIVRRSRMDVCIDAVDGRGMRVSLTLRALPDADYAILKTKNPWIIAPQHGVMGCNLRVPEGKTQIIYLPESLEGMPGDELKLVIAHEFAHCVLGHTDSPSDDPVNEEAAWQQVIKWGLGTKDKVDFFREKYNQPATQS